MGLLTKEAENRMLHWMLTDPSDMSRAFVQPIEIRLMASNGDVGTPGVEITGDTYEPSTATWARMPSLLYAEYANINNIVFSSLDIDYNVTVAGIEVWDSSTTPVRLAFVAFDQPVNIPNGSAFTIAARQLKVRLS